MLPMCARFACAPLIARKLVAHAQWRARRHASCFAGATSTANAVAAPAPYTSISRKPFTMFLVSI
jgi:hypothetical protein